RPRSRMDTSARPLGVFEEAGSSGMAVVAQLHPLHDVIPRHWIDRSPAMRRDPFRGLSWAEAGRVDLAAFTAALEALIRAWSPVLPVETLLTVPPQGASAPGPYAALALGERVAEALGLTFAVILTRTDIKRWHGPHHSLRQAPFECTLSIPAPIIVLVVDDLV